MNPVLSTVLIVSGVGLLSSILLVVASKFFSVPIDERVEQVTAALPNANCGACGYAGCADYAAAIVAGTAKIGLCMPGGDKTSVEIARIMGADAVDIEERLAVVRCRGNYNVTRNKYDYDGVKTCAASAALFAGQATCPFGCIGFGDCAAACKFGAMSVQNGVAVCDQSLCNGCGACAAACPKGIIEVVPVRKRADVLCRNHDKGGMTRKECSAGCIGCMRCQKVCEHGAVTVTGNLATVDPEKCVGCGKCAEVCPIKCIGVIFDDQKSIVDVLLEPASKA